MKYTNYKLKDFILDEYFKSWVVSPDKESDFFWESFLKNNPDRSIELVRAREIILTLSFHEDHQVYLPESKQEEMWMNILSKAESRNIVSNKMGEQKSVVWLLIKPFRRVAAVLLIAFFISLIWFMMSTDKVAVFEDTVQISMRRTEKGEKISTTLPDGSVVVLNANSWIEYPEKFSDSTRNIRLGGEAFFDITKDPTHPFVIEAGQFKTEVLGTSFSIREDDIAGTFILTVVSGRVAVSNKSIKDSKNVIYVEPKQMIYFNKSSNSFHFQTYNYSESLSWKDGILCFKNANLNEIIVKLENWYGIKIILNDTFDSKKDFTGQFVNENLEVVLEGLGFIFDFNYEINQSKVVIKKRLKTN